ncbi:non-ribosomal peptide synthetase [Pseudonocardia sp. TRM90224]|uniref:non-ribosomal peptide synthetase n=1 Tax=Pseudonocardia sp. TRM90224 TaxID=2812678 RepID=UPI001E3B4697|nr:non-ribosomal peptide synthetase [Pseudonocardia sp. TRM90224]
MTELSAAKRAVLDRWKRGQAKPPAATITRREERGEAPLSSTQERVWYLDQLVPGSAAYNFSVVFHLDGPLDEPALRRALTEIVRRHDSLRATFPSTDGRARQLIAEPFEPEFSVEDLTGETPDRVRERMAAEAGRILSLEKGPLIAALLLLAPDRHALQLTLHHIACDGWSLGVLNRELVTLYRAYTNGEPSPLPELPIQYGDFAAWQQEQRAQGAFRADLDFWTRELAELPTLALPTDHPRPAVQRFQGARLELELPQAAGAAIRDICKAADVTPYMLFLGAFTALLSRYSGQDDIAVGSPIANRTPVETEALIGYFSNTIVLRTDLAGDPSFRDLLGRIRQRTLAAYAHQGVPFEELVNELAPERDTSRNPLFQVMMVVQNAPLERVPFAGLDTRLDEVHTGTSKFDLWLQFMAVDDTWTVTFEYNTDLWDAPTISRMAEHLTRVLTAATADPTLAVSEIPLLGDAERHQVLAGFNDTAVDLGPQRLLHEHIEEQAGRTPDSVAVAFDGAEQTYRELTYRELDGRANALARELIEAGVGPDTLVGVHAERSAELVVALLAVLKSGGAYVPLEPSYPEDRLRHMIRDTAPQVLLTDRELPARLADLGPHVVRLGGPATSTADSPAVPMSTEQPAYVIYTSGSTGLPKGAINSHRGIGNRLLWMQDAFGLTAADKVLQKTPFSFDVSVWEFFWPLMTGATLVVARPDEHKDPTALLDTIRREGITTVHFVPSMLRVVLDHPALSDCTSLVRVVCSGEALPAEFRDRFFERLPGVELHNLYGPTEAAVDVTAYRCREQDTSPVVPIGKPIANTEIYILDRTGQPAPIGIPGELHIGGVNVGLGYLRRPELDAERFVPDPFGAPGARMYRTGDLARWLPSGDVEFLGRLDSQVKVRGMRIELGEIESTLRAHPGVADAAVVVRSEGDDRKQLVAYAVPAGGDAAAAPAQPTSRRQGLFDEYMKKSATAVGGPEQLTTPSARALVGELREHLHTTLPDFMIPHAFVVLARLPVTTSGKLDRRALPAPVRLSGAEGEPAGEAPSTPTERTLAAIWADVLGIEHVAVDGNFFELGGDSIDSIQVVARATEAGLRVTPADIVRHPSVRRLATAIGEVAEPAAAAPSSSLPSEINRLIALGLDVDDVHPLSRYQTEMLRRKLTDGPASLYVQSIETRVRSTTGRPIDLDALEAAWRAVADRHSVLRSSFRWADVDEPELVVHRSAEIVVERHDLSAVAKDERAAEIHRWVESVRAGGFALDRPGHLRVALFPGERPDEIGMAFLYNYMFSDGWSLSFVLADLLVLLGDPDAELAPVVPYRHYIDHQRARDDGAVAAFWRRSMAAFEVTPLVATLGGTPRTPVEGGRYLRSDASVSAEATGALRELARGAGLTLSNVVLAAWALVLARWTGRSRVSFGNMMTGRSADVAGYERMVGIFTSVLPMQLDVPPSLTFLQWVEQAQRLQLDLDAHHHVALEEIRGWAGRPAGSDLYESCFVFLNFPFSSDGEEARRRTELRIVEGQTQTEHPLRVAVFAFGEALDLQFFHYEKQLPASAVEEVKAALCELLERLAGCASEPVGELLATVRRDVS